MRRINAEFLGMRWVQIPAISDILRGCGGTSAAEPDHFRSISADAGRRLLSAINASSLQIVRGHRAYRDAIAILLSIEHDAPADHDMGGIDIVVLMIKLMVGLQYCVRAEGNGRNCSCVKPSKSLTADRMRMSSSTPSSCVPGGQSIPPLRYDRSSTGSYPNAAPG